jgi:hypothetical protein
MKEEPKEMKDLKERLIKGQAWRRELIEDIITYGNEDALYDSINDMIEDLRVDIAKEVNKNEGSTKKGSPGETK